MIPKAANKGLTIRSKGAYTMTEAEDNNLKITFTPC